MIPWCAMAVTNYSRDLVCQYCQSPTMLVPHTPFTHMKGLQYLHSLTGAASTASTSVQGGVEAPVVGCQG